MGPDRQVAELLRGLDGVNQVLDEEGKRAIGLDHPRSGELVALAAPDRWFSYYWWLDDARAPDFAPTVDIHRKPGYDPMELFLDPKLSFPQLRSRRMLARKLGFRNLLDVIPDPRHLDRQGLARPHHRARGGPVVLSNEPGLLPDGPLPAATFKDLILAHVFAP